MMYQAKLCNTNNKTNNSFNHTASMYALIFHYFTKPVEKLAVLRKPNRLLWDNDMKTPYVSAGIVNKGCKLSPKAWHK